MSNHNTIRCASIIACLLFFISGPVATGVFAQQGGSFSYSSDADAVVLEFRQEIGMLESTDRTPLMTIYGDGWINVHFPAHMNKAGDYRMHLTPQELSSLLTSVIENGVMEFDVQSVKAVKKNAALQRREAAKSDRETPELIHHSDGETTIIEIHLDQYLPADNSRPMRENVRKKISWHGLRWDARHYPGIASLKGLADAVQELNGLVEHENLQKVYP